MAKVARLYWFWRNLRLFITNCGAIHQIAPQLWRDWRRYFSLSVFTKHRDHDHDRH